MKSWKLSYGKLKRENLAHYFVCERGIHACMRTESECCAHSFSVIREVSVLMEFTSRHLRYHFTDVPPLGHTTTQHTTRHDTGHGTHGTRDTGHGEAIAEVLFQWSSWVSCVRSPVVIWLFFAQLNFPETHTKHQKVTKQCPFWCIPYPFSRSTITTRSSPWRSDAVMCVILREEARYDVPKVPLASPEFSYVTVCSLTPRRIFDILTACQKSFVITKNWICRCFH